MLKLHFSIEIKAPSEKVWDILWNDDTYRKWTGVFNETSHAVTDWKEGSKVLFLTEEKDGMYSIIERNIQYKLMSFRHLGSVKKGIELPSDEESQKWYGTTENYELTETGETTVLKVDIDAPGEYKDFFEKKFPEALGIVKELSEV